MIAEGMVGPAQVPDGVSRQLRMERTGGQVVSQGHAPNAEAVARGNVMMASNAVAGVAPGTALSTTPPMAVWNPPGSGKNLVILKTALGYVSGTLGAGSIVYAQTPNQTTPPSTGSELVPVNSLIGAAKGVGRAFSGSTLWAAPTIMRPAYILGAALATTALGPSVVNDLIDGAIIVPPGTVFVVQGVTAAGSTPLVMIGVTWEEVPV
jgi:uncharacterized membrane protein YqaE (UPF0057 family)